MLITFESNQLIEVGEHDVFLTVALDNYNRVRSMVRFKLKILACEIESFRSVD